MSNSENYPEKSISLNFKLRTSRRRRTVGLTITDTGELVVHAPKSLSLRAIQGIVDKHLAWIAKKQAERQEAWERLTPGQVYYRGQALALEVVNPGPPAIHLEKGVLRVSLPSASQDPWSHLLDWYHRQAAALLAAGVQHFAAGMGLKPPPLELRNWRRRWGECHPDGRLRFNWRLVLLPPEILDYLVVHELAHLLVPGHPPRFWQEVGKYLPDYASRRRWLRMYGSPFLSWQWEAAKQ
jgi:predicted metal-dependent hydrolase